MKKLLYIAVLALCAGFTSCEKDEIGGTATEATAGQWYVSVNAVDENNNVVFEDEDLFGLGQFLILTYNTSDNKADEMFVDDLGNFWDFKCKVKNNINDLTFATEGAAENYNYDMQLTITDGKILPGAGVQKNGSPADSISFYVVFSDDDYINEYYSKLHIAGVRYSGLAENE